jgi:hypothetical protein
VNAFKIHCFGRVFLESVILTLRVAAQVSKKECEFFMASQVLRAVGS